MVPKMIMVPKMVIEPRPKMVMVNKMKEKMVPTPTTIMVPKDKTVMRPCPTTITVNKRKRIFVPKTVYVDVLERHCLPAGSCPGGQCSTVNIPFTARQEFNAQETNMESSMSMSASNNYGPAMASSSAAMAS